MPRPKKAGGPEPKKRSRNGCWPCKGRKVKCDELHPACLNCQRQGETCDYSIRLNWDGRGKKKEGESSKGQGQIDFSFAPPPATPSAHSPAAGSEHRALPAQYHAGDHSQADYRHALNHEAIEPRNQYPTMVDPSLVGIMRHGASPYNESEQYRLQNSDHYKDGGSDVSGFTTGPVLQRVRYSPSQRGRLPSPPTPDIGSPGLPSFANVSMFYQNAVPPTQPTFSGHYGSDIAGHEFSATDRPLKRARYDSLVGESRSPRSHNMPPPNGPSLAFGGGPQAIGSSQWPSSGTPLTPGASSTCSDDTLKPLSSKLLPYAPYDPAENARRKPSIESLLSGPAGMGSDYSSTPGRGSVSTTRGSFSDNRGSISTYSDARPSISETYIEPLGKNADVQEQIVVFGLDRGFKDLDLPSNDDLNALSGRSPLITRAHLDHVVDDDDENLEFGFGVHARRSIDFGDEYYSKPVEVTLPRSWEPLPQTLNNPMHMLYFHHFISHTARILVPHHCSANPFQRLLPQMALQDPNIMSLLLAYSASHRARLLRQPVPAMRISHWVQDIVPNLSSALSDPTRIVDNSTFATAIMLASLEIICPGAFGADIGWEKHLSVARQMIAARGGSKSMQQEHSEVTHFLLRWFAYLDIMGNLTGGQRLPDAETSWAVEYDINDGDRESFQIDCVLGFTSRCITILAQISDLAQTCDKERMGPNNTIKTDYAPSSDVQARAQRLIADAEDSLAHTAIRKCPHPPASGDTVVLWDNIEATAVNTAYHWAGLVHLHRRALGKPTEHEDVQRAVREILDALSRVGEGSTAEACLLFPMFTAGCDALAREQKSDVMKRIKIVEDCGLSQVRKARTLMEKVWETGKPWETLAAGEFVG